jgi:CTP:molybdopterin cytidylyltransferase MocA
MPMVNKKIYNHLISYRKKKDIIVPTYNNIQVNPVLFSKSMRPSIMTINGDIGAKKILELNIGKMLKVKIDDVNITRDFNTKNDFNSSS